MIRLTTESFTAAKLIINYASYYSASLYLHAFVLKLYHIIIHKYEYQYILYMLYWSFM